MIIKKVVKCDICDREVSNTFEYVLGMHRAIALNVKKLRCGKWKKQQVVICHKCIASFRNKRLKEEHDEENRIIEWRKGTNASFAPFTPLPKKEPEGKPDTSENDTGDGA